MTAYFVKEKQIQMRLGESIMPPLYVVVGLEWAIVVHIPEVKTIVAYQPGILKVGDEIILSKGLNPKPNYSLLFKESLKFIAYGHILGRLQC